MSPDVPEINIEQQEARLVARIRRGDLSAFDALYLHYYSRLLEFAYRYLGSRDAAEDVVQDTMFAIWRNRETWNVQSGVAVYLYGAVRNRALHVTRHMSVVTRSASHEQLNGILTPSSVQPPDSVVESTDLQRVVRETIRQLNETQQRVLLLRWQEGLTGDQIAEILGISKEAAWKQIRRAEQALRGLLDGKV